MRLLRVYMVLALCCATFVAHGQQPSSTRLLPVEVFDSGFGIFYGASSDTTMLHQTEKIPAIEGRRFGWFLLIRVLTEKVTMREEYELPQPLASWGTGEAEGEFRVSTDRRTAISERVLKKGNYAFVGVWAFREGHPFGTQMIRIYANGRLIKAFEFEVVKHRGLM